MKQFKDLKPEDISELVGSVTISFRVKLETKLKLQAAAQKYNTSFAKLCENLIENKLKDNLKIKDISKPLQSPRYIYFDKKSELIKHLKKEKLQISNQGIEGRMEYDKEIIIQKMGSKYTIIRTGANEYKYLKENID